MSGILDVLKSKTEGRIGGPAMQLSMAGAHSSHSDNGASDRKGSNVAAINSNAADYARERAAAAKAQIEARKAMEEERKAMEESRKAAASSTEKSSEPAKDTQESEKKGPVPLRAPIKRPLSASINRAQALAAEQAQERPGAAAVRAESPGVSPVS